MFNLPEPLTLMGLLALASTEPTAVCQMPKPAEINVIPRTAPVKYDTSQSLVQLQQADIDTINPYGFSSQSHTNGYMKGKISMRPEVKLDHKMVLANQGVCIWYDTITLKIEIEPTIVIASEVAKDPCKHNAVKEHELKHVMVDRKIVNKYGKSMGKKIFDGLQSRGFLVGPVKAEAAQEIANRMNSTVGQLIELEYKKMEIERAEAQQAVDSLEEYQRVNSLCKKTGAGASRHRH